MWQVCWRLSGRAEIADIAIDFVSVEQLDSRILTLPAHSKYSVMLNVRSGVGEGERLRVVVNQDQET